MGNREWRGDGVQVSSREITLIDFVMRTYIDQNDRLFLLILKLLKIEDNPKIVLHGASPQIFKFALQLMGFESRGKWINFKQAESG
jgi:hypothetical protein